MKRDEGCDNGHCPVEQATCSEASHDPASNQHLGRFGEGTDEGTQFEDNKGADVGPFVWEVCKQLARGRLQGGSNNNEMRLFVSGLFARLLSE